MRLKKFMMILCLLPLLAMRSQNPGPSIQQNNARLQGTYTFNTYLFVASTGAGSPGSITSGAATLTAGDFVFVQCGHSLTDSITFSSTPANTFVSMTAASSAGAAQSQAAYVLSAGAGSTTFTCTMDHQYLSMVVLLYHHSGLPALFMTGSDVSSFGCNGSATTTCASLAYPVNSPGLIIYCTYAAGVYTAGAVGPGTGTLRGVSAATLSTSANNGCEDYEQTTSAASQTSTLSLATGVNGWYRNTGAFY